MFRKDCLNYQILESNYVDPLHSGKNYYYTSILESG
jgi:hypothetical protein